MLVLACGPQVGGALHHTRPLVLPHPPLKEVGLAPAGGARQCREAYWSADRQMGSRTGRFGKGGMRRAGLLHLAAANPGCLARPAHSTLHTTESPRSQPVTHCSEIISIQSKGFAVL